MSRRSRRDRAVSSIMSPPDFCVFCKKSEENEVTGKLQKTPDGKIVAHYNCMVYCPSLVPKKSLIGIQGFEFDIKDLKAEIKRGKKLSCGICKRRGATVGCDIKSCTKTYHYACLVKAKGFPDPKNYVVYCKDHKPDNGSNSHDSPGTSTQQRQQKKRKRRKKQRMKVIPRKKARDEPQYSDGNMETGELNAHSEVTLLLPIHLTVEVDHNEDILPSTSGQNLGSSPKETESTLIQRENHVSSPRVSSKKIEPIVQKLKDKIVNPTEDAEQSRDDEAIPEGSTNPRTEDQPVENNPHEHLQNQESSAFTDVSNQKVACDEESKSIANAQPQQTEDKLPERPEIPEEPTANHLIEDALLEEAATTGSVQSECTREHQSTPTRPTTSYRRRLRGSFRRPTNQLGFHSARDRVLDGSDGIGLVVADQCRRLSEEKQTKYMLYVLASADLFQAHETLPDINILIDNLQTLLERSQQSISVRGSSV
ncbi:uncharacterized protein RB166_003300 [Leptodactylus fuscus]|uniref:uncharacterized protein LOC142194130 n=1 Tax=Leptodactylus fuscus TaxID=238119 RepID=UPI003F4E6D0F